MATVNKDLDRLATILRELKDAVVVCDQNAQILLYNSAAKRLFLNNEAMGLGKSLYTICARAPIENTLKILKHRSENKDHFDIEDNEISFVCSTIDGKKLLQCHIGQVSFDIDRESFFIITFEDMTRQITESGKQGYLLEKMITDLRAPITNLNMAVDNLKKYPEMNLEVRSDFEEIIFRESKEVMDRFEAVVKESMKITSTQWPLFDVYSGDLIGCAVTGYKGDERVKVTMVGVPLWLRADSYSLVSVLNKLIRFVCDSCDVSEVDIEALLGDRRVYIDIIWKGEPISQSMVNDFLDTALPETGPEMTIASVLERHNSEIWSQQHREEGFAILRIPLPDSPRQWETPPVDLPARPEFYDFALSERKVELDEIAHAPLSSLNYVVFDTETTGVNPSEGDEIVAITAVRIVNGRILSGEFFEQFIKPKRPIPESSQLLLDISEEIIQTHTPIEEVLPKFISFVGDAVLVGHNSTFDMHFFQGVEQELGLTIGNPVLDTLLLSLVLDPERTDYTLESVARWLQIDSMTGRTMLDNCFVAAQVFLSLMDKLEGQGIKTLGDVFAATTQVVEKKRKQLSR